MTSQNQAGDTQLPTNELGDAKRTFRRPAYLAALGALLLAGAYFGVRGPCRAWSHSVDLHVIYAATRTWATGGNPYDPKDLAAAFESGGGRFPDGNWSTSANPSLHPPVTLALLFPLGLLPFKTSENTLVVTNVLLTVLCILALIRITGMRVHQARTILFIAFALALAPFHTAISQGQLTVAVATLVLCGLWAQLRGHNIASGILIALATALKPQMGLAFCALLVLELRWRAVAAACVSLLILSAVSVGRMELAGVSWLNSFLGNVHAFSAGGSGNPRGTLNFNMINLQVVLCTFLPGRLAADMLAYALAGLAGIITTGMLWKRSDKQAQLLAYAMFGVLTLLAMYNRIYSATLLILPLAWAFAWWPVQPLRRACGAIGAAILPFIVPGAAALSTLGKNAGFPYPTQTWWWKDVVLLHQVYLLAALMIVLLYSAWRVRRASSG